MELVLSVLQFEAEYGKLVSPTFGLLRRDMNAFRSFMSDDEYEVVFSGLCVAGAVCFVEREEGGAWRMLADAGITTGISPNESLFIDAVRRLCVWRTRPGVDLACEVAIKPARGMCMSELANPVPTGAVSAAGVMG